MQNLIVRQLDTFRSQVSLEPLKQGFGHTLGNALRRVLLSSIAGAAPTEVVIKGVKHEYSTIDGVQEDVINIILNIKGIRFSVTGRDSVELKLKVKGPGVVKAKDIELPHDVEILNPDHVIANLTQTKSLEMTIRVQRGQGYVPAAQLEEDMGELSENAKVGSGEGNIIFLDASFSPVKKVSYVVENARVEQRTDYDRLILDIETNGTVSPEEVVTQAARILQEQLAVFSGIAVAALNKAQQGGANAILAASIDDLELTVRSANALKSENINTVRDLVLMTEDQLMLMANLGKKSLLEIKQALGNHALHLGMEV